MGKKKKKKRLAAQLALGGAAADPPSPQKNLRTPFADARGRPAPTPKAAVEAAQRGPESDGWNNVLAVESATSPIAAVPTAIAPSQHAAPPPPLPPSTEFVSPFATLVAPSTAREKCSRCLGVLAHVGGVKATSPTAVCVCCKRPLALKGFPMGSVEKIVVRRCMGWAAPRLLSELMDALPLALRRVDAVHTALRALNEEITAYNAGITHRPLLPRLDDSDPVLEELERREQKLLEHRSANRKKQNELARRCGGRLLERGELFKEWIQVEKSSVELAARRAERKCELLAGRDAAVSLATQQLMKAAELAPKLPLLAEDSKSVLCGNCPTELFISARSSADRASVCHCCMRLLPNSSIIPSGGSRCFSCNRDFRSNKQFEARHSRWQVAEVRARELDSAVSVLRSHLRLMNFSGTPRLADVNHEANTFRSHLEELVKFQSKVFGEGDTPVWLSRLLYSNTLKAREAFVSALQVQQSLMTHELEKISPPPEAVKTEKPPPVQTGKPAQQTASASKQATQPQQQTTPNVSAQSRQSQDIKQVQLTPAQHVAHGVSFYTQQAASHSTQHPWFNNNVVHHHSTMQQHQHYAGLFGPLHPPPYPMATYHAPSGVHNMPIHYYPATPAGGFQHYHQAPFPYQPPHAPPVAARALPFQGMPVPAPPPPPPQHTYHLRPPKEKNTKVAKPKQEETHVVKPVPATALVQEKTYEVKPVQAVTQVRESNACGRCDAGLQPLAASSGSTVGFCDCCKRLVGSDFIETTPTDRGAAVCRSCWKSYAKRSIRTRDWPTRPDPNWVFSLSSTTSDLQSLLQGESDRHATKVKAAAQELSKNERRSEELTKRHLHQLRMSATPVWLSQKMYLDQVDADEVLLKALFVLLNRLVVSCRDCRIQLPRGTAKMLSEISDRGRHAGYVTLQARETTAARTTTGETTRSDAKARDTSNAVADKPTRVKCERAASPSSSQKYEESGDRGSRHSGDRRRREKDDGSRSHRRSRSRSPRTQRSSRSRSRSNSRSRERDKTRRRERSPRSRSRARDQPSRAYSSRQRVRSRSRDR